jgi:hypothetical protein
MNINSPLRLDFSLKQEYYLTGYFYFECVKMRIENVRQTTKDNIGKMT